MDTLIIKIRIYYRKWDYKRMLFGRFGKEIII